MKCSFECFKRLVFCETLNKMFEEIFCLKTIDPCMQMLFMLCTRHLDQSELSVSLVAMATAPFPALWAREELIRLLSWQPHNLTKKLILPLPPLSRPPSLPPSPSPSAPSPLSLCLPLPPSTHTHSLCLPPTLCLPLSLSILSPTPYRPFVSSAENRTRASRFGGGVSTTALSNGRCRG